MFAYGLAVLVASLLGSLHCVGMCGPLAIWATGNQHRVASLTAYHLGRLTTYLSAGLMAGLLGSAITLGGDVAGFQSMAARICGGLLIFFGILRIAQLVPALQREASAQWKPSKVARWLHQAKPVLASRGPLGRGYLAGLLTTWLPCGWLYLFVLVAAGSGSVFSAIGVMTAFWVGTLPAL